MERNGIFTVELVLKGLPDVERHLIGCYKVEPFIVNSVQDEDLSPVVAGFVSVCPFSIAFVTFTFSFGWFFLIFCHYCPAAHCA